MKKIVCEICGSQSIRKENGVFVCQECGTEYSAGEVKSLLREVDSEITLVSNSVKKEDGNKASLLKDQLLLWAKITYFFEFIQKGYFKFDLLDHNNWSLDYIHSMNSFSNNTFYGPTDKKWLIGDFIDKSDIVNHSTDEFIHKINQSKKFYEQCFKDGKISNDYYSKEEKIIDEALLALNNIGRIDYESSQLFWNKKIDDLLREKFCFEEIKEITNSDEKLGSYLLNDKHNDKTYIDISNPDRLRYYNFLTRYYLRFSHGDRPTYIVEKKDFWGQARTQFMPAYTSFNFDGLFDKIFNVISSFDSEYHSLYDSKNLSIEMDLRNTAVEYLNESIELEKVFCLPFQYRRTSYILKMIDMLDSGKASSWKELINLFDTQIYRESVIDELQQIGNKLANIGKNLNETNNHLKSLDSRLAAINDKLSSLSIKMNSIVKNTDIIRKYSKVTAWSVI